MKKLVLFFLMLTSCFVAGFYAAKNYRPKNVAFENFPKSSFSPSQYTLINRPFTIAVVGRNNGATIEKTLTSIFSQNYDNFRLIYIDDASSDGSRDLARDVINQTDKLVNVTFVQNEEELGKLANIFRAVEACENEEIVVVLDGEDWLAHEWVLQRLNAYYAHPDLWLACGSFMDYPTFQKGSNLEFRNFRQDPVNTNHLKTFYAKLFKNIRESDLIYSGKFLPACAELAYMTPMLEMAKEHFQIIDEVLLIHNKDATYKESRESQLRSEKFIRALDPYPPLTALGETICGE